MPFLIFLIAFLSLSASAFARSKKHEDFPDYNRLEYTKERPPAEQQAAESIPGSIQMRVGDKKSNTKGIPIEELPVMMRPTAKPDSSEPPMDFIDAISPNTPPAVSTATTQ